MILLVVAAVAGMLGCSETGRPPTRATAPDGSSSPDMATDRASNALPVAPPDSSSATETSDPAAADRAAEQAKQAGKLGSWTRELLSADESQAFFRDGVIPRLRIQLQAGDAQKLRENGRQYVPATVSEEEGTTHDRVVLKLKGAAGSYQDLDARPAFTLKLRKPRENQLFHGLEKWHLNNSVQDESYLCELVCSQICQWIGIPTPRATHARVWLNDRDLGLYVLKESFDQRFLARHFDAASGNLYDGGFVQDIDADLELDAGDGPLDRADLKQLVAACRQEDPAERHQLVERYLDVRRFISFMAFEAMTCHWDGYTFNRNNYRVYFEPQNGAAHFFPHGMDQMFGDPGFPLWQQPEPLAAAAIWLDPAWRGEYRQRVAELRPLFASEKLFPVIDAAATRIESALGELGQDAVQRHREQVAGLKDRVRERARVMAEMMEQPDPAPLAMQLNEPTTITDWYPVQESDDVQLEAQEVEGEMLWRIECLRSGMHVASWRSKVLLGRGRYEFTLLARSQNIVPLAGDPNPEEARGKGAGIRISGSTRPNELTGNQPLKPLTFQFTVQEALRTVELVAELRGQEGQVWFQGPSRLTKIGE
ncbi:MAG: CotH kinase family protein [Planctomycetota bacterium]